MSLQDAANAISFMDARERILKDPTLSPWQAGQMLYALDEAKDLKDPGRDGLTPLDILHGAEGAGLGYGVGVVAAKLLGASDSMATSLKTLGLGLGTFMNMNKTAAENDDRDARMAFRIGFLKQAAQLGMLKESAQFLPIPTLPLTPETFAAPIRGLFGAANRVTSGTGALLGHLDSPDDTDKEALQAEAEAQELNRQADLLEARRKNRLLGQVLAKRS